MKKKLLLVLVVVVVKSIMADPKDNFKKSAIYLGGSVSGATNVYNTFNENEHAKSGSMGVSIDPYVGMFIIDNLSIRPRFSLSTHSSYYWKVRDFTFDEIQELMGNENGLTTTSVSITNDYQKVEYGFTTIGVGVSAVYYITNIAEIIPYVGLGGYISRMYAKDEKINGETSEDDYSSEYGSISLESGLLYFLSDHVALNFGVDMDFSNRKTLTISNGENYKYPDDYNAMGDVDMNTRYTLGFTYYFPKNNSYYIVTEQ